jgi:hypothetical protein
MTERQISHGIYEMLVLKQEDLLFSIYQSSELIAFPSV